MDFATVNPATGETVATYPALTDVEVDAAIERSARLRRLPHHELRRAGRLGAGGRRRPPDAERERVAALMTTEMGKTLAAAAAEADKCARTFRFYAEHAEGFLADEPVDPAEVGAARAYARYQPLGPVLAVMPWNFPLWQVVRFLAPALVAGNTGLLKHASNVPGTALFLEELVRRGVPRRRVPDAAHRVGPGRAGAATRVRAATLTGSERAGRAVAAIAGDEIKPTVLELGGSDPFVVTASADLDEAARVAAVARCQNNGQSCIAAKRFIVFDAVADEFERRFVDRMAALRLGDPTDPKTDVGPLATERGRRDVEELVAGGGPGGDGAVRRRAARRPGLVLPADGRDRGDRGHAHVPRGGVRPGRRPPPCPTPTPPWRWPTPPASAWGRTCGAATPTSRSASCATSTPAPCSSTA